MMMNKRSAQSSDAQLHARSEYSRRVEIYLYLEV